MVINDLQNYDAWKTHLTIAIQFISSKDAQEERVMRSMQMKLLTNFLSHFLQGNLETSIKGSEFIFGYVQLVYCKFHKVDFRRGSSNIDSSDWVKEKKATINLKNG